MLRLLIDQDLDQVMDYALDLHHFHEGSHHTLLAPVLVATEAPDRACRVGKRHPESALCEVTIANEAGLAT